MQDWYSSFDKFATTESELEDYDKIIEKLENWERDQLNFDKKICVVRVKNMGRLIMPLVLDIEFDDGSIRILQIPAEIWRYGSEIVRIPFLTEKAVSKVQLDKENAFADSNLENNVFPRNIEKEHFKLKSSEKDPNPMRDALYPEGDDKSEEEAK